MLARLSHVGMMAAADEGAPPPFITSALLHFDGPDGSTVFVDETGKEWLRTGSPIITTGQSRFGGSSLKVYGGGLTDHIETAAHSDFDFGVGDFTIQWWQYWTNSSTPMWQAAICRGYNEPGALVVVTGNADGKYNVLMGTSLVCAETSASPTGEWVHYALTRHESAVTLWRNGAASAAGTSGANLNLSKRFAVGGYGTDSGAPGQAFNGCFDEWCATKGSALYVAPFTPPPAPFSL